MVVNLRFEFTDEDRRHLGALLRGGSKPATRRELREFAEGMFDAALSEPASTSGASSSGALDLGDGRSPADHLYRIDEEDREALRGRSDSYVRGWNQVKHWARSKR